MTGTPITPDEFRLRMKEIDTNHDIEEGHMEADASCVTCWKRWGTVEG